MNAKTDAPKLDPPDFDMCQAEIKEGSFMTLGPRKMVRCKDKPKWLVVEPKAHPPYTVRGSMTLCDKCAEMCRTQLPDATFVRI